MDIYNLAGTTLGNYEIERLLGRGGMGVVYKARQISLNRVVALKILPPAFSSDPSFVKRFEREAHSIARLNHPHISQIYDIGEEDGVHFFSMEYIKGKTLEDLLKEEGFLDVERAIEIIAQAAEALQFAHEKDVVHRDIKPSNIMIDSMGRVKVMDFGLAKVAGGTKLTDAEAIIGTIDYMSPEQANAKPVDLRTDIWSLGVVFYEILAGSTPFDADSAPALLHKIIYEDPPDIRNLNPDVPTNVSNLVARAMAKERKDRYQSLSELLEDVHRVQVPQAGESIPTVQLVARERIWSTKGIRSSLFKQVLRLKPTFGRHFRIRSYICLAILSTTYVSGFLFIRIQTEQSRSLYAEKGIALARTTASLGGYGVLKKDPEMLDSIIEGFQREPDVAYVIIYDSKNNVLANTPVLPHHINGVSIAVAQAVAERALRTDSVLIQLLTADEGKTPAYDIAAPIIVRRKSTVSGEEVMFGITEEDSSKGVPEKIGVVRIGISLETANKENRQVRRTTITVMVVVTLLASLISVLLVPRIVNSVR
ncbi:MAG: serine/threonine-protein kinase [Pseudomonadota bacterium]